jgi:ABC-2 type transport system ATP-binding protein
MLCGLLKPSNGSMVLCGEASNLRSASLRSRIGYMSQKFTLYDDLTVLENLRYYAGVYDVPEQLRQARIGWALKTSDLENQEDLLTGKLPGGWKQRLAFASSVMHEPEVLFLDEPTSGVDPLARRQLWKMIRQFAGSGMAILVTTHFLEEAEHCQKLAFMVAGKIVAQGAPGEIKSAQPGKLLELKTSENQRASDLLKVTAPWREAPWKISIFADRLHVVVEEEAKEVQALKLALNNAGIELYSSRPIPFSLEDAFIGIVQREAA